jgi:predicted O-linked N-acetylglucosamine transferase (SPINDLY family)
VQVTYLGYPATTGLDVMDYRITDGITEPPGSAEAFYTETLYRLPHTLWCYQPFADMPAVSRLPALARGAVTFGSFNSYTKIGPRVIELWTAVLHAVPASRLVMITVPQGQAQQELQQRFAAAGIAAERVVMHDRLLRREYLALFSEIDIALDPFPCNGGTTTCDALWMGLPVITLIGDTFLSRASYSLLSATGLTAFAAPDAREYIARCAALAADLPALSRVRDAMRTGLSVSPLLQAAAFTQDLEAAYRTMWRRWCASRSRG